MSRFLIVDTLADISSFRESLTRSEAGGFCSFEGWVRHTNDGRSVSGIEYVAFIPLAMSEGQAILDETQARFDITTSLAMHRTGYLEVGDIAVWIGVAAPHRDAAFRACRYVIDEIKKRVPIWKREHYVDGCVEWVACHQDAESGHVPNRMDESPETRV
ncbi:molybdenum cofactor biosynthesis protein MoaE [Acetobacter oeni]|uniref:Molybdopterin synthase catalytic subunit n=1 Tax=Acetobacter oeni TaxID=304077 RepID=A0A511XNH9_9PROT|nr:molybdenum cofactor biosynthesis protein MoaE [Acetobacter oeni]MBB3884327.1 molybdopterin synthase catalytic subunit [Acetobacter oeni]NHO20318.1 molybdenum cofactor biosynthesis protein MoaE [Acetobacter oeni]GBR05221.1 molybdopterin synthase subunit MoaE [Acetobacter oeni LMG 21952]GEN64495.1 molybdopterin-converting factor chain 2 [Acetobacter oeni]